MISKEIIEKLFIAYAGEQFKNKPTNEQTYEALMYKESYSIIRENFLYSKLLFNYARYYYNILALIPENINGTY